MITALFDESMENGNGHVVVAGFMGNKAAWIRCVRAWKRTLKKHGRDTIHLKELRFKGDRHKALLADLGKIPASSGLCIVYGGVNVSAYKSAIEDTVIEVASAGYIYAFQLAILAALKAVPKGQRLEVICEDQKEFNDRRANVCAAVSMMPEFIDKNGLSKLAKWGVMCKSTIVEPSDFLAFSILQRLVKPKGIKAQLCAPIWDNKKWTGKILSAERSLAILNECIADDPSFAGVIFTPEEKKAFIKQLPFGEDFKVQMAEYMKGK